VAADGTTSAPGRNRRDLARARAELAAARAQEAALRVEQIRAQALAGHGSNPGDVASAVRHAEMASQRAQSALESAAAGWEASARRHDLAATAHETAARIGSGDIALHLEKALAHRLAAETDRRRQAEDEGHQRPSVTATA